MTQRDTLKCVHEPFGDAFYFGPERLSSRYEKDEKEREESGFSQSTYKTVLERIDRESSEVGLSFPSVYPMESSNYILQRLSSILFPVLLLYFAFYAISLHLLIQTLPQSKT